MRYRHLRFEDCDECGGEGLYCKECKERSEYEYECYLDGKMEEALEESKNARND
jgi:hypothetical protein